MTFDTEPEWMKKARQAPLRSTWESRQHGHIPHPQHTHTEDADDDIPE